MQQDEASSAGNSAAAEDKLCEPLELLPGLVEDFAATLSGSGAG